MKKQDNTGLWVLVIIIFFLALIIYVLSLGQWDLVDKEYIDSFAEKRRLAEIRHKKLLAQLERKEVLKKKLDFRFKITYFIVRILFLLLYAGLNITLYFFLKGKNLGSILEWNEIAFGSLFVLNLIFFGTELKLKNVIKYFKDVTENKVYGKYVNIDDQIASHKTELTAISADNSNEHQSL